MTYTLKRNLNNTNGQPFQPYFFIVDGQGTVQYRIDKTERGLPESRAEDQPGSSAYSQPVRVAAEEDLCTPSLLPISSSITV